MRPGDQSRTEGIEAGGEAAETGVTTAGTPTSALILPPPSIGAEDPYPRLVTVETSHYAIGDEISKGGMGRIRVAKDRRLDRKVAIKEVLRDSGELARRFEREARITARLQHPSIVSIHEAGQWPNGIPFYVMPHIEGRSLDEVLRTTSSLDERLPLVPHVLAVADAVAYAHRHKIIHRDLKPKNVMIGPFGETIVIDWGLAKDLAGDGEDGASTGGAGHATPETDHRAVLGTPAYMAPEQAQGPDVDERADAYSLGAILYELLAGRAPYGGPDVLAQVRRGPPAPLRDVAPGVPADLAAIVAKAMARDPADRYPSAKELADDLRRFQTGLLVTARHHSVGERLLRWVRRHRALVASVAAIAAITAVAFTRVVAERDRAQEQRRLALAEREAAERLVDYVIVDLRRELARQGRLEPMFGVGGEIDRYYERLEAWRGDRDPEAMRRRAQALEVIGDVQDARGENARAAAAYRAGLVLRRALPDAHERRHVVAVAKAHMLIGRTMIDVRAEEARAELDEARRLVEPFRSGPLDVEAGIVIAGVHRTIGDLALKRDELERARGEFQQAIEVLGRAEPRDDRELRAASGICHERLGVVSAELGEHERALASFRTQLEIAERLATEEPTPARRAAVEIGHGKVGRALGALGRIDEAEAHHAKSAAIARQLVAIDPTNIDWWHALSASTADYGTIRLQRKDLAGAQAAFTEAHDAIVQVARAARDHQRFQRHVAVTLSKLGQVKMERGDLAGAADDYRKMIEILDQAVARDPQDAMARQQLAIGHSYLGELHLARKEPDAALASFRAVIASVQDAARGSGDHSVVFTKILAVGHGMVSSVHEARGAVSPALDELGTAIDLLERLRGGGRLDAEGEAYRAEFERKRTELRAKVPR